MFVTSPSRYADISAWQFLREIRWRGVPMLFVLNRLPPDRDAAVALLNDFAERLHSNGLLLEPDAEGKLNGHMRMLLVTKNMKSGKVSPYRSMSACASGASSSRPSPK